MSFDHIDSWKNSETAFYQQLWLNKQELNKSFENLPLHWKSYLVFLREIPSNHNIYDIGCGCGGLSELTNRYYPNKQYTGFDYSEYAIKIAKENFPKNQFIVSDYKNIKYKENTILVENALLDVLPNADEALETLLQYNFPFLILLRVRLTNQLSYYNEYMTPYNIMTYDYYHNEENIISIFAKYKYNIKLSINNIDFYDILLEKE